MSSVPIRVLPNSPVRPWPKNIPLRDMQARGLDAFFASEEHSFLAVATPGSGKTILALRAAHQMIASRQSGGVLIVVPTTQLCSQWKEAALTVGLALEDDVTGSHCPPLADDKHGWVVTWAAISANPELFARLVKQRRALVIFDEIHHAGDERAYGRAASCLAEAAPRVLCLSGTPFRSGKSPIACIRYLDGVSVADFTYTYLDAMRDRICRPVLFSMHDGVAIWDYNRRRYKHNAADKVAQDVTPKLLRAILDPTKEFAPALYKAAWEKLQELRVSDPRAGMLAVVSDVAELHDHAKVIEQVCGVVPVVVASWGYDQQGRKRDTASDAPGIVKTFRDGDAPILLAVRMVSEGADVPRLRVGVYATACTAELFYRQWVGRFVRVRDDLLKSGINQDAYLFQVHNPILCALAEQITSEVNHVIDEIHAEEDEIRTKGGGGGGGGAGSAPFRVHFAGDARHAGNLCNGNLHTPAELALAASAFACIPTDRLTEAERVAVVRRLRAAVLGPDVQAEPEVSPSAVDFAREDEERESLRKSLNQSAKAIGMQLRRSGLFANHDDGDLPFKLTLRAVRQRFGFEAPYMKSMTLDELRTAVPIAREWVSEVQGGTEAITDWLARHGLDYLLAEGEES